MSDDPLTLRGIIRDAPDDELFAGLTHRGAKTRRLANGEIKIEIRVKLKAKQVQPRPARVSHKAIPRDAVI